MSRAESSYKEQHKSFFNNVNLEGNKNVQKELKQLKLLPKSEEDPVKRRKRSGKYGNFYLTTQTK